MSDRRRGLGRGLGALIPDGPLSGVERPVDVFFPGSAGRTTVVESDETAADRRDDSRADVGPGVSGWDWAADQTSVNRPTGTDLDHESRTGDPRASDAARADALMPVPGVQFAEISVAAIGPNQRQPRQIFAEEELEELAGSIRAVGVLQPVVVRPALDDAEVGYELIMGERRWRAAQAAGLSTVPAIVRFTPDGDMLRDALLENLHRVQLNPLEEAAAYHQLLEDFSCTHDELASRVSRSRPQITNTIRLLRLPPAVQRRVAAGVLSAGHARAILGLLDADAMDRLAQRVVAEGLSVRATEEIVALGEEPLRRSPRRSGPRSEADLGDVASRLSDRLDTRVRVTLGQRKGRIAIEFASVTDLNRILDVLSPGDPGVPAPDGEIAV